MSAVMSHAHKWRAGMEKRLFLCRLLRRRLSGGEAVEWRPKTGGVHQLAGVALRLIGEMKLKYSRSTRRVKA